MMVFDIVSQDTIQCRFGKIQGNSIHKIILFVSVLRAVFVQSLLNDIQNRQ